MTFFPIIPPFLTTILAAALLFAMAHGAVTLAHKNVPRRWILGLACLRVLAILLFVLCLLRPVMRWSKTDRSRPDLMVLLDTSRSMGASTGGNATRLSAILRAMRTGGLLPNLEANFSTHWFAFDEDARPLSAGDLKHIEANGETTAIGRGIQAAWNHLRNQRDRASLPAPIAPSLLLVSDGNDLGADDAVRAAKRAGAKVFVLPPPDVEEVPAAPGVTVVDAQSPRRVLLGSECRLRVTLRQTGLDGVPLVLEMLQDNTPLASRELTFGAQESERLVTLTHRPSELGVRHYALRAVTADGTVIDTGEPLELTLEVVGRSNKILIFEDTWRWQFRFLRRLLEEDPNFTFTSFLSRGSGIYMQFSEPDNPVRLAGFPQSQAELEWFDVIILGDVDPARWPRTLAPALHRLVVDHGKSLIVLAGPGIVRLAQEPLLESLLPVELTADSARPIAGPVLIRPSTEGARSPMFFAPEEGTLPDGWQSLPPMDQVYPPLRKKPAATVLMETPHHANAYGPVIVMAEHVVGQGRVVYIGTDTLWKWQTLAEADTVGNTPYRVFWQQTLRALAPDRWASGVVNVWLQTDRTKYRVGQTVQVKAEIEGQGALKDIAVEARVSLPDNPDLPLVFLPDADDATVHHSDFVASSPGPHRIVIAAIADGKTLADASTTIDVERPPGEMSRVRNDLVDLQRLASETGGSLVDPSDPNTWPEARETQTVQRKAVADLWSHFWILGLLTLTLAFDWLLRLLHGFV